MRSLENTAVTPEQLIVLKNWQGRVFEKPELGCYEAVFVIELRGISVGVNNPVMPVLPDNTSVNQTSTLPSFKESTQ